VVDGTEGWNRALTGGCEEDDREDAADLGIRDVTVCVPGALHTLAVDTPERPRLDTVLDPSIINVRPPRYGRIMNDLVITVNGWVATTPSVHVGPSGERVTAFRLASTSRYYDRNRARSTRYSNTRN